MDCLQISTLFFGTYAAREEEHPPGLENVRCAGGLWADVSVSGACLMCAELVRRGMGGAGCGGCAGVGVSLGIHHMMGPVSGPLPPPWVPHPHPRQADLSSRRGGRVPGFGIAHAAPVARRVGPGSSSRCGHCARGAQGLGGSCAEGTFGPLSRDIHPFALCAGSVRLCESD